MSIFGKFVTTPPELYPKQNLMQLPEVFSVPLLTLIHYSVFLVSLLPAGALSGR